MTPTTKSDRLKRKAARKAERARRKALRIRRKAVKSFVREQMENSHPDVDLLGVFIDETDGDKRVMIIARSTSDRKKLERLAEQYFTDHLYKIKYETAEALATSGPLQTGEGICREGSEGFGTVGGYFRMRVDLEGKPMNPDFFFGLSNNHVIGKCGEATKGDWLTDIDGKRIGRLYHMVPLKKGASNGIDAAIFLLNGDLKGAWNPVQPVGKTGARPKMGVYKVGAKSKKTTGIVTGVGHLRATLCGVEYWFEDVIAIKSTQDGPFSQPGDSGSMVLTANHKMLGLLFYKVGDFAYACPVKHLAGLNLSF